MTSKDELEGGSGGPPRDDRLQTWLGFAKFVLGTFTLGLVTTCVNQEIQHREIELREEEHVARFVEYALDANVGYRKRLAEYFAAVTRSPELRERWREYRALVAAEDSAVQDTLRTARDTVEALEAALRVAAGRGDSLEARLLAAARDSAAARVQDLESEVAPTLAVRPEQVRPRVYFHIAVESQRDTAEAVAAQVRAAGFLMPGIERVNEGPSESQLRYFRRGEAEEAQRLGNIISDVYGTVSLVYVPGYETSGRIRPRHYELWLRGPSGT